MADKKPYLSVICPVYNAEKTVSKMIESVLAQDYENIELIIVDDVSKDSTPDIIKNYAEKDSRVIFVKAEVNNGPGPAKNSAIKLSKGEFITFIDGDDYIDSDTYSSLIARQKETDSDVVAMGYTQEFLDSEDNVKYSVKVVPSRLDGNEAAANAFAVLDASKCFSFCWNKLIKASLIKENNIEFPPIMHSEDFFFNMALLPFVKRTATLEKAHYHYIKPAATTLTTSDYIKDYYTLSNNRYNAVKEFCVKSGAFEGEIAELAANTHIKHLFMCLIYNCSKKSGMKHKQRIAFAKEMLKNENTVEALKNAQANGKASKLMNFVLKTKSPALIVAFGRIMYIAREKFSFIFDKLK